MENVLIEKNGEIGIVTVNRPQQMNSMNSLTRSELAEAFNFLENDKDIAVFDDLSQIIGFGDAEEADNTVRKCSDSHAPIIIFRNKVS